MPATPWPTELFAYLYNVVTRAVLTLIHLPVGIGIFQKFLPEIEESLEFSKLDLPAARNQ